tara:strand:- start:77 stop:514 length:438 start_codon:yes stop_codon:yes gene_type:complete
MIPERDCNNYHTYKGHDSFSIIRTIIKCSRNVFKIGTGFSEAIYQKGLEVEFRENKIDYENQKIIPISYRGYNIGEGKADLVVNKNIIIELKAVGKKPSIGDKNQLLTYMNNSDSNIGIVINFPQSSSNKKEDNLSDIHYMIVEK